MTSKKLIFFQFTFIAVLSLYVTLTNLGVQKNFIGDDAGLKYYDRDILLRQTFSMWDDMTFPGEPNVISTFGLIYSQFVLLLYGVGFGNMVIERILFFFFFFLSSSGFLLLLRKIHSRFGDDVWVQLVELLLSVQYAFNSFTMIFTSFPQHNYHLSYMLFPWIFYLYLKNFEEESDFVKITFFSFVIVIFLGGNVSNTVSAAVFLAAYVFVFKKLIKIKPAHLVILIAEVLVLSAYIYIPILFSRNDSPFADITIDNNINSLNFNSRNTSLINVTRFLGFHSPETLPYGKFLTQNIVFILASFVLPLLILIYLRKKEITRFEKFLIVSLAIFAFLAKGNHPPLGGIFTFMFTKVYYFQMFRAVYYKFVPYIVFTSILLGSYAFIYFRSASLKIRTILVSLYITVIIITAWPMWAGSSIRNLHLVEIPQSYRELRAFLDKDTVEPSILSLPQPTDYLLSWGRDNNYAGFALQVSSLVGHQTWSQTLFNSDFKKFLETARSEESVTSLMRLFGFKYLMLHKDIPEDYFFGKSLKGRPEGVTKSLEYSGVLKNSDKLEPVMAKDFFTIYELRGAYPFEKVSSPKIVLTGNLTLKKMLESVDGQSGTTSFVDRKDITENEAETITNYSLTNNCKDTEINYQKASPTKYSIEIRSGCGYVPILLIGRFDPNWKLVDKFGRAVNTLHVKSNVYSNTWLFNLNDYCEKAYCTVDTDGATSTVLDIVYLPQAYFERSLKISALSFFLLCTTMLVKIYVKYNKRLLKK